MIPEERATLFHIMRDATPSKESVDCTMFGGTLHLREMNFRSVDDRSRWVA